MGGTKKAQRGAGEDRECLGAWEGQRKLGEAVRRQSKLKGAGKGQRKLRGAGRGQSKLRGAGMGQKKVRGAILRRAVREDSLGLF